MDLHGFDPGLVQLTVIIVRKKLRLVNSALKATSRGKLKIFLMTEMFFLVHPKWVSNWEPASETTNNIRTCTNLRTFRKSIMRNPSPPLNMKMFLRQVVELHSEPLPDSLFGYDKIKIEGTNIHKTTFTTNCDTMPYNCLPSSLFDTNIALKGPIHAIFDELVSLHDYVDDLIICV